MRDYIEKRIQQLRNEITIISIASNNNNLKLTKFENKRVFDLRSKINILTEVLETSEKQVDEAYDKGFIDAMVKYRK